MEILGRRVIFARQNGCESNPEKNAIGADKFLLRCCHTTVPSLSRSTMNEARRAFAGIVTGFERLSDQGSLWLCYCETLASGQRSESKLIQNENFLHLASCDRRRPMQSNGHARSSPVGKTRSLRRTIWSVAGHFRIFRKKVAEFAARLRFAIFEGAPRGSIRTLVFHRC